MITIRIPRWWWKVPVLLIAAACLLWAGRRGTTTAQPVVMTAVGPRAFVATRLEIRNLPTTINIVVEDRTDMEIQLQGRKDALDAINMSTNNGDVLRLDGSGYTCPNHTWGIIVINNGNGGNCSYAENKAILRVPSGTSVTLTGSFGDTSIGDIAAPLAIDLAGSSDIHIGQVTSLTVRIAGSGDVTVGRVNGPVSLEIAGSGDIQLPRGEISSLNAKVAGQGSIQIGASVKGDANVTLYGSGDISVACVSGNISQNVAGSGRVDVGRCS